MEGETIMGTFFGADLGGAVKEDLLPMVGGVVQVGAGVTDFGG